MCHQGTECTLNHIRGQYWVIRGRQVVKLILKKCVLCKFVHAKTALLPSTPNLPNYRVSCNYSFENVGADCAGPLYARNIYTSTKKMYKCYVLFFTCSLTRAVHIELAPNLGLTCLILALRRFISRRVCQTSLLVTILIPLNLEK